MLMMALCRDMLLPYLWLLDKTPLDTEVICWRRKWVNYIGRSSRIVAVWKHGQHGDDRSYTEPISET